MTDLTTKQEIYLHEADFNERNTHVDVSYTMEDREGRANASHPISVSNLLDFIKENGLNVLEHFSGVEVQAAELDAKTYLRDNLHSVVKEYLEENLLEDGE